MAVTIIRPDGGNEQVELNGMALYREAMDKKVSFRQLVNAKFPTVPGGPDAFQQMCISAGLRFSADQHTGIPAASLRDILDPSVEALGSYTQAPYAPDSRVLFPAALMEVIEDKLQSREEGATSAFESLVGYRQTVASPRVEQPVISYRGAEGPESAQFQTIAQNTRPALMLSITASEIARRIPTTSIGMEISREAMQATTLDLVAMTMLRFYKKANYREWTTQLGFLLSGDADGVVTTMDDGTAALSSITAKSLDATIVAAGVITQSAWLQWLYLNSMDMTKTDIVCDFATAMAIDGRTNRPTNVMNDGTDRLDTPFRVSYPSFTGPLSMVIMPAGTWPANTIMAIDKSQAIAKITSSAAEYSAVEDVVMKKSLEFRVDRGFICFRLYSSAFNVLTLTV
jgi:hypothetical protein